MQQPLRRAWNSAFKRYDYSRDGTLRSLEQSMQRLGTSRIDIVYIHDVDAHGLGSDEVAEAAFTAALSGALPVLHEMKRAGGIQDATVSSLERKSRVFCL